MEENREKSVRPQNKNLKPGGPGRPQGQRNYATIYREALHLLADKNATTPEKLEAEMIANAAVLARKGDYRFYKDILDRVHGTAVNKTDITTGGKDFVEATAEIKKLTEHLNEIHRGASFPSNGGTTGIVGKEVPDQE